MEKFLVILVSFLVILSFAKEKPLIIIYQMKIVELSEETVLKLGLSEGNFEKDTEDKKIFNVIYDPMLMKLLFEMSQMVLKIDLGKSNIKEKRISRPWIATILDKNASLLVGKENLSVITGFKNSFGMKISLMPLSIENGLIFTKISFTNLSGSAVFNTHVHVPINKFVPVSIVSIKNNQNFFEWGVVEKKDRKYFAFFISASLMKKIPEDNVYSIGAFDELIEAFWEEKQVPKDNHLTITLQLS